MTWQLETHGERRVLYPIGRRRASTEPNRRVPKGSGKHHRGRRLYDIFAGNAEIARQDGELLHPTSGYPSGKEYADRRSGKERRGKDRRKTPAS